jgi:hypothetical protein
VSKTRVLSFVVALATAVAAHAGGFAIRLINADDGKPATGVRVTALRPSDLETSRGSLTNLPSIAETRSGDDGWARFASLPEGPVIVAARVCDTCLELSDMHHVPAEGELGVSNWRISAPASVEVQVIAPDRLRGRLFVTAFDWRPLDQPQWPKRANLRTDVKQGEPAAARLSAGRWQVQAIARVDNAFAIPLDPSEVVLLAGDNPLHQIVAAISLFDGRVLRRGEPVRGVLNLIPVKKGKQVAAQSDRHGHFAALIETPGEYEVMFQDAETRAGLKLAKPVDFSDPDKEVIVELPGGRIEGRTTNTEGVPLAQRVELRAARRGDTAEVFAYSNEDGTFVIDNLGAGTWDIELTDRSWIAEAVNAEVPKDGTSSGVVIIVSPAPPPPSPAPPATPPSVPPPSKP